MILIHLLLSEPSGPKPALDGFCQYYHNDLGLHYISFWSITLIEFPEQYWINSQLIFGLHTTIYVKAIIVKSKFAVLSMAWSWTKTSTMIPDSLHTPTIADMGPSIVTSAAVGLIMLLGFLRFKTVASEHTLPGIPELKGVPILGAVPLYFTLGAPQLLKKLIAVGSSGISYANLIQSTLVSVHDPVLAKQVLSYPKKIASKSAVPPDDSFRGHVPFMLTSFREGDPTITNMSPWWTLRRLIGLSLFNYVGPDTVYQRNVLIREFNSMKSNAEKFDTMLEFATAHVNALTSDVPSGEVEDVKLAAENFAIALWGEVLYGNRSNYVDGRILGLSETLLHLAGSPWPSVQYAFQVFLKLVTPGEPTRSEAKIQERVVKVIDDNLDILEKYEHENPNAPLKTIRSLSVNTGGERTGPLSRLATEFSKLNLFG